MIWKLEYPDASDGQTFGMVVRADSEEQARCLADVYENQRRWLDTEKTTCEPIGANVGESEVILAAANSEL